MVPLAPRGTSPPSGSMGRHLNPRPNAAVSNVNVPAVAVAIAAQSDTRWMRRTAPRQSSVPTGCTPRDGCAVNSRSTATAAAPRALRKRRERRRRWPHASFAVFDEWLAAMVAEAEPGYSDDAMHPLSREAQAVGRELPPSLELGCQARCARTPLSE